MRKRAVLPYWLVPVMLAGFLVASCDKDDYVQIYEIAAVILATMFITFMVRRGMKGRRPLYEAMARDLNGELVRYEVQTGGAFVAEIHGAQGGHRVEYVLATTGMGGALTHTFRVFGAPWPAPSRLMIAGEKQWKQHAENQQIDPRLGQPWGPFVVWCEPPEAGSALLGKPDVSPLLERLQATMPLALLVSTSVVELRITLSGRDISKVGFTSNQALLHHMETLVALTAALERR